jgi:hypothetical protein
MKKVLFLTLLVAAGGLLMVPTTTLYFESGQGARCTSCHEMKAPYALWRASSHRGTGCEKCHGQALTLDVAFHQNNLRRAAQHVRGELPERIGFGNTHAQAINGECQKCHRQEYAAWQTGPHGASYARIFLDKKHNSEQMLMDDCLRCHGAHFDGGINALVAPINRKGPWRVLPAELAERPSMPCVTCHQVHREGQPMTRANAQTRVAGPKQELARPSLAFFDRRTQDYVPVSELPIPSMLDGARAVKMSPDARQALCYQCHAPTATRQVGSGDDRTVMGVHEGLSCLACHSQHGQKTRASCATCHPKLSNCGLDVEKMDTTFASDKSKHNIHWVKCADCHTKGVPPRRARIL